MKIEYNESEEDTKHKKSKKSSKDESELNSEAPL